jgi:hypothetical protein
MMDIFLSTVRPEFVLPAGFTTDPMSYSGATSRFEAVRYGVLLARAVFRQSFALEKSGFAANTPNRWRGSLRVVVRPIAHGSSLG